MISYAYDMPCSPTKAAPDIRMFFKRPRARRALTELGPNDTKANLRMADSLLTISTEQFIRKWNFDPVHWQPLPGRYHWKKAQREAVYDEDPGDTEDLATVPDSCSPVRLPPRLPSPYLPYDCDLLSSPLPLALPTASPLPLALPTTPRKSPKNKTTGPTTPKTKQCKITDYGRQRKRLHSTSKCEEGDTDVYTPRKKAALSSSPSSSSSDE